MRYLTAVELVAIADMLRSFTPIGPLAHLELLESALAQPQQTFDRKDLYKTPAEKAAALLYSICMNHAFVDGNKRVAWAATQTFLRLNGWTIDAPESERINFVLSVAAGEQDVGKVALWIGVRLSTFG